MFIIDNISVNKLLRRFIKLTFTFLPPVIRRWIILNRFNFSQIRNSKIIVKVATEEDEIIQALKLHQKRYEENQLCEANESESRLTKYQLTNGSCIIVAKNEQKVVGTISVLNDDIFGLPSNKTYDLDPIKAKGHKIVEFSAFAIEDNYLKKPGEVLFPLMKFAWNYSAFYLFADSIVAVVYKKFENFYIDILMHEELRKKKNTQKYDLIKPQFEVSAFTLDLTTAIKKYSSAYRFFSFNRNVYAYMVCFNSSNFIYPKRQKYFRNHDFYLSPKIIESALGEKLENIFSNDDITKLKNTQYFNTIENEEQKEEFTQRRWQRFKYNVEGSYYQGSLVKSKCTVIEVSFGGVALKLPNKLTINESATLIFNLGKRQEVKLRIRPLYQQVYHEQYIVGCQIIDSGDNWKQFIAFQNKVYKTKAIEDEHKN